MGSYLSEPVTTKESDAGESQALEWGACAMQGWRTEMEDAHVAISNLGGEHEGLSLFGVFDGHGGKEVAAFCREHLPTEFRRHLTSVTSSRALTSQEGNSTELASSSPAGEALVRAFHGIDDMLRLPKHQHQLLLLKQGASLPDDSSSEGGGGEELVPDVRGEPRRSVPEVVAFLQSSIESDLSEAQDRGAVTKEEALQVMRKMALLRRLQDQGEAEGCKESRPVGEELSTADHVGCTAVCVLVSDSEVVCANAGDSRALLCRAGQPVLLSNDHKPHHATEKQRIEAGGGHVEEITTGKRVHYRVNGNLNLSRALGDLEYKKQPELGPERQIICATPDIVRERRTPQDEFIVVACDGVWDVKSNEEVCAFVGGRLANNRAPLRIAEELVDACLAEDPKANHGLGGDNMTCVIVRLLSRGV